MKRFPYLLKFVARTNEKESLYIDDLIRPFEYLNDFWKMNRYEWNYQKDILQVVPHKAVTDVP